MRVLILAHAGDLTALRVRAALQAWQARHASGVAVARIVWLHDLAAAARLSHTVDADGAAMSIRLRDGTEIDADATDVLFNRLRYADVPAFSHAVAEDRDYAAAEMHALLLSWLTGVRCPVINAASPGGLGGAIRHPLEWYALAGEQGLRTPAVTLTSSPRRFEARGLQRIDSGASFLVNRPGWFREPLTNQFAHVLVLGQEAFGDLPPATRERAAALVHRAGLVIARCQFQQHASGEWVFVGVDQWPDLSDDWSAAQVARLLVLAAGRHHAPVASLV